MNPSSPSPPGVLDVQIIEAQKLAVIGLLAGGVAHDLSNILGAIAGFAEGLRDELPDDSIGARDADLILAATSRGTALLKQLLAFSRRQNRPPAAVDIVELLRQLGPLLPRLLGERIKLEVVTPARELIVKVDPVQIEQVVLNLAINARDAMPDGGPVAITLEPATRAREGSSTEFALLRVRDAGIGMATQSEGKGTGLGLATAHAIVTQYGGSIAVESQPGQGTTFEVLLPLTAERKTTSLADADALARGNGESVLVVEDDRLYRQLLSQMLGRQGYKVLTAQNGLEALEVIAAGTAIDLVISDLVMPKLGGHELAAQLARLRPALPLLFISGDAPGPTEAGITEKHNFLEKPFTAKALLTLVRRTLDGGAMSPRT